jgi:hypothetical protein
MSCPDCPPQARWLRRVIAGAIAVAVLALLAAELLGAPVRKGRVERVERPRFAAATAVRICPLVPPNEDRVTCYGGAQPTAGTRYTVVDEHGVRGAGTARSAEVSQQDPCRLGSAHDVAIDYDAGRLPPRPQGYTDTMAVQGLELSPRARILTDPTMRSPSGRDSESIWKTIDLDGDARVDFAVTYMDCSAEVRDVPAAPSGGQKVTPYCMEYWLRDEPGWRRVNREVYYACW